MTHHQESHEESAAMFVRCARALYGDTFVAPLAARLQVEKNTVGKWSSGKSRIPPGIWAEITTELGSRETIVPWLHHEAAQRTAGYRPVAETPQALKDDEFFVFLSMQHPMSVHNLRFTKAIISAGFTSAASDVNLAKEYLEGTAQYMPYVPNPTRQRGFVSLFSLQATTVYEVEYDAEYIRANEFRLLPSRMSCVYAFKSMSDCQAAAIKYGWNLDSVRKFRLLSTPLNRVHRANMEIVSLMRFVLRRGTWSREERDQIWRHYWQGGGTIKAELPGLNFNREIAESGEIWEWLIEGRLDLVDPL